MKNKNIVYQWVAMALFGLFASFSFAADASDEVRNAWLTSKLYGNDNDGASLRRVTISEAVPGRFSVLIENQFGFQCNLAFGEDGHPRQLSGCVSKGVREGVKDDEWFVQEPDAITLNCAKLAKEIVCKGRYVLASGNLVLGPAEMTIAMSRSALPQAKAGLINQPTVAHCTASNVNIRSKPSTKSDIVGQLGIGRAVLVHSWNGEEGAWYKVDLPEEKGNSWVFSEYVTIPDAPTPHLAQILLDFGNTPAKAQALFGPPVRIAQTALEAGGDSARQETLFYPEHQAVYVEGVLSRVILEPESSLALGRWKLGQASSSLASLGEAEKKGGEWSFMISPSDRLRFKIRQNRIAGAEYVNLPDD